MDMTNILKELLKEFPMEELNKLSLADFTDLAKGLVIETKPAQPLRAYMIKTEKVITLKKGAPWSEVIKQSEYSIVEYAVQDWGLPTWAKPGLPVKLHEVEVNTTCQNKSGRVYVTCTLNSSGIRGTSKFIDLDGEVLEKKDVQPWLQESNFGAAKFLTLPIDTIKEISILNGSPTADEKPQEAIEMDAACDKLAALLKP